MRIEVPNPAGGSIVLDDGVLDPHLERLDTGEDAPTARLAFGLPMRRASSP